MELLWSSSVGVVGVGSGGSAIALGFARAGVGEIRLSDPQVLSLSNVSRHELGLSWLGQNKATGVACRIHDINPHINVEPFACDLFDEGAEAEQERFFDGLDLIVGCTDKTAIQLLTNFEAVTRSVPAVFGGCYESARGGEVLFWLPGLNMPCLECLRGGLKQPEPESNIDYSTATGPEDYEGEPGLHAAIGLINSIETEIALAVLLRDEPTSAIGRLIDPSRNFLLIGGLRAAGFYRFRRAFDIHWQPLTGPRRDCRACAARASTEEDKKVTELLEQELGNVPADLERFLP